MKKGFSTLFIVIILGSIAIGLVLALSTDSFWVVKSSIGAKDSSQNKSLVNACAEIALENMRENNSLVGSSDVVITGNTCTYIITNTGGTNRTISASGTINGVVRKLEINTTGFNPIAVSSWQEVQ